MFKVVGIVGYKDSGKTTLTRALSQELTDRGHEVAVIKHTHHRVDLPGKDTAVLGETASQVAIISSHESGVFWGSPLSIENIIAYLEADIILVEGFKAEGTFPKIVCLRGEPDDQDLFDGLVICAIGPSRQVKGTDVPILDRNDVGKIADLVEQKAFKLPNLDCGGCGHERCYDLARGIVAGIGGLEECIYLQPIIEVWIDGQLVCMNPSISGMVRGTILGLLSSLNAFRKGKIEIGFGSEG